MKCRRRHLVSVVAIDLNLTKQNRNMLIIKENLFDKMLGEGVVGDLYILCITKKWVGNLSKTDSIQSQISSKIFRGEKDTTKIDTIKDITSDSLVNSHFHIDGHWLA